jgi:hypothetical protein
MSNNKSSSALVSLAMSAFEDSCEQLAECCKRFRAELRANGAMVEVYQLDLNAAMEAHELAANDLRETRDNYVLPSSSFNANHFSA